LRIGFIFNYLGPAFPLPLEHKVSFSLKQIDLADTTVGQDLWQYRYLFSGFTFQKPAKDSRFSLIHNFIPI